MSSPECSTERERDTQRERGGIDISSPECSTERERETIDISSPECSTERGEGETERQLISRHQRAAHRERERERGS